MPSFHDTANSAAPPEEVWKLLYDPSRFPDWWAGIGTVEITSASLRWGALAVDANGALALDEQLQPVGTLDATIESDDTAIDALAALGKLRPGDIALIKNVVRLMATSGRDGKKRLTLPLSLKNDRVYLGPAQIAALPRVSWE